MVQTRNSSVTSSLSPDTLFPQSSQTGVGNRHVLLGNAKLVLCSRGTKLGTDSISGARGDLPVHEHEQTSCAGHEHGKSAQSCSEESSRGAQTWLARGRSCMAHQIRKKTGSPMLQNSLMLLSAKAWYFTFRYFHPSGS